MSIRLACLGVALTSLAVALPAQDRLPTPVLSPPSQLTHTVGLTQIELSYSAPSVRGRTIMGAKVPYDVVWRTGANATTSIRFSTDVTVGGHPLPAGKYGIHTLPGEDEWQVMFNSQADAWGSYNYDPALDVAQVTVRPERAPFREQMRFAFENVTSDAATLVLHWETTAVPLRIETDLAQLVLATVREAAAADDDDPGWEYWFQAADYGRQNGIPTAETLDWNRRSLEVHKNFTNLWMQSELLIDAERMDEAAEARESALKLVTMDELQNLAYRYHQRADYANSERIFSMVVSSGGNDWWPYTMLAEARKELGDKAGAAEALRGALTANPDPVTRSEIESGLAELEGE